VSRFIVVIPVRLESERLPGKPLVDIVGKTMIERVHAQACASRADEVIVATDSPDIESICARIGARVEITSRKHASGTDRIAEVAERLAWPEEQIVVNVQGDEPLIPPALIDQVAGLLEDDPSAGMATLMTPLTHDDEYRDPHMVKVVTDCNGSAIYFSRAPVPWDAAGGVPTDARRHVGLYAYRAETLCQVAAAPVAPPERAERLEQLRALWLGHRIAIADAVEEPPRGVDTEDDLEFIRELVETRKQGT